jgi:hypothetical protein
VIGELCSIRPSLVPDLYPNERHAVHHIP